MDRPDIELEQNFKKLGITIVDKSSELDTSKNYLSVHVEIGFPLETQIDSPNFDVVYTNERGKETHFKNFKVIDREKQKILMFETVQDIPDNVPLFGNFNIPLYTTYLDLCWKLGTNKIDESLLPSVDTVPLEKAVHADLGYILPSRFVDSVTYALGMLNVTILCDTISEALIYGPFYVRNVGNNEQ